MAATRIVRELLSVGIVEEFTASPKAQTSKKNVGRPKTGLRIAPGGLFAAGITISAYHSEVTICDASGEVVANTRFDTLPFDGVVEAARFYGQALRDLIEASQVSIGRIVGIGVALSARTDPEKCEIITSEYFGWGNDGGAFCRELREIVALPVEIENITNALALAEMRFGVARDVSEFALIHAATFVGASIVSEGRIVRGNAGISGLVGHFRATPQDLKCVCGRQDCLNLSATGFGLLSQAGKLDHPAFDTAQVSSYAASLMQLLETDAASANVARAGANLAPALDSMAKLLGPKMIVISGYLGAGDTYFAGLRAALERDYDHLTAPAFDLVQGTITSDRSAALLALHTFCYSDRLDYERFADGAQTGASANG